MKEYVSLRTAIMKMGKRHFTVVRATAAKRKRTFIGYFCNSSRAHHLYLMFFLKFLLLVGIIET